MTGRAQALEQIEKEFEAHQRQNPGAVFQATPQASGALSSLVRDLEIKRQTSELTGQEQTILRRIDKFMEKVANYNAAKQAVFQAEPGQALALGGDREPVYDLQGGGGSMVGAPEGTQPPAIPKITSEDAEKIISDLNEQFEQKVLSNLQRKPEEGLVAEPPRPDAGRNLHDYLKVFRADLPDAPFADRDSQKDLSHHVRKNA